MTFDVAIIMPQILAPSIGIDHSREKASKRRVFVLFAELLFWHANTFSTVHGIADI
jgi:hypothetical protein